MNGIRRVYIHNVRLGYDIMLRRNVTIIKGKSGSGKSTLIDMLTRKIGNKSEGIKLVADARIEVLGAGTNWEESLSKTDSTIFFADEYIDYIGRKDFMTAFNGSGNYLVVITRGVFKRLDYAVSEVYQLKEHKKGKLIINTLDRLYKIKDEKIKPDLIITEDSKTGRLVLQNALGVAVDSANGKNQIPKVIEDLKNSNRDKIYVVVDGAAFGKNMEDALTAMGILRVEANKEIEIFTPESFEWLCLNTDTFKSKNSDLNKVLNNTEDFIDYTKDSSWEKFYTEVIKKEVRDQYGQAYSKNGKVSQVLKTDKFIRELKKEFKDIIC